MASTESIKDVIVVLPGIMGSTLSKNNSLMSRNIRTLYNFEPPATDDEIREAAQQFVRKISGFAAPSVGNEMAFHRENFGNILSTLLVSKIEL